MQDTESRIAGDARLQALLGNRTALVVVLGISLTLFITILVVATAFILTSEDGKRTLDSDFRVFWATARLTLEGDPLAAFDFERIDAEYNEVTEDWMPWLYPPGYLFAVMPLGALPYAAAFLAMTLLSVSSMALASRPFVGGVKPIWAAMTLAPAYMPALVIGQNSLIWLAVLLAALHALRAGRAVLAGVLIGCLTLKPQLGLMIPVALLAAGEWRTILAASVTAVVLAAVPTLIVGADYWPLLANVVSQQADRMVDQISDLYLTVGSFYLATSLGLAIPSALILQWSIATVAAVSVYVFWRSSRVGFDAKVAILMIAILLSAPYLWYYEAAMMAFIGLFLVRAGILTARPLHLCLLFLLWFGAGWQSMDLVFRSLEDRYLGAVIVTPVVGIAFALSWVHFFRVRRTPIGAI